MYRSTLNSAKKIGIWSTTGKQPISGLTPACWYSFIVSAFRVSLSPLCFLRSSVGGGGRRSRLPGLLAPRRKRVETAWVERMAAAQAPDGQPAAAARAMDPDRLERVRTARRVEPAVRPE